MSLPKFGGSGRPQPVQRHTCRGIKYIAFVAIPTAR